MADTIQAGDVQGLQPQTPQTPSSPDPSKQGTGFVNLQKVLEANRGSNLGSTLGSQTQGIAQNTSGNIQQAGQAFQNASSQAFQPYSGGQQFIQNTIQNPTGVAQSDINRFQTISGGQYTGPKTLTDTSNPLTSTNNSTNLQSGVSNLQNEAQLGQSFGGRQALLGTLFNNPQYGSGQQRLDAAILSQDPSQSGALGQLQRTASNIGQQYKTATDTAQQQAAYNQGQAQQLGTQATQGLSQEETLRSQLQTKELADAQQQQATNAALFGQTTNAFGTDTFSQADLARLGLGNVITQGETLYNLKPTDFLKTNLTTDPTNVQQTTTQAEAARINALGALGGKGPTYADLSQVGTFNPSTQTFDVAGFTAAQQQAAKDYQGTQDTIDRLTLQRLFMHPEETAGAVTDIQGPNILNDVTGAAQNYTNLFTNNPVVSALPKAPGQNAIVGASEAIPPAAANMFKSGPATHYLYGDIAQQQVADAIQKYGSLENAKNAVGANSGSSDDYATQSKVLQDWLDKLAGMGAGNTANIVGDYANGGTPATPPTPAEVMSAVNRG